MSGHRGPALQRLGLAILLQGDGVRDQANLAEMGLRYMRLIDGAEPSAALRAQVAVLTRTRDEIGASTRMSVRGRFAASGDADPARSEQIDAAEAARLLGYKGPRQVTRRARDLGGQRVSGVWVFDRSTVEAAAKARSQR